MSEMDEISQQLPYHRLRNRVPELLEPYSSFHDIAKSGVFAAMNMVEDRRSLNYGAAPGVFSQKEKDAFRRFVELRGPAANVTREDTQDVAWLESPAEWRRLPKSAKQAFSVFAERGRFFEDCEGVLSIQAGTVPGLDRTLPPVLL